MMKEQAYYLSLEIEGNNVRRRDRSLVVNCTGLCVLPRPFDTFSQIGREDYYLQYLVKGEMTLWIHEQPQLMQPGQAVFHYPHTGYRYAMSGEEEVQYYWVHFTGADADALIHSCRIQNQTLLTVGSSPSILSDFEGLFHDFILRDHCLDFSAASRLLSICTEISRRQESAQRGSLGAASRIYRAITYIHQNYEKDISVCLLAELEHLSPSRFRALFREATGLSPMDYLAVLRLNHARQLMLQAGLSIGEIAQAVGYQDQLYFSRIFRKRTGLSPTLYRQRLQEPAV